jgi:hypothetical protein
VAINWLPLGSVVEIGGERYTVHDRGGRGLDSVGRVDIYDPEGHAHALGQTIRGDWVIRIVEIH